MADAEAADTDDADLELAAVVWSAGRRARFRWIMQALSILLIVATAASILVRNGSSTAGLRVHVTEENAGAAVAAVTTALCPTPVVPAAVPVDVGPFIPRPLDLVGVPEPIAPILPARAPDGSYLPYHTSITDPIVYDVFSPPPAHPLKLLNAHQALPALSGSHFGNRYIIAAFAEPGRFNNGRLMVLALLWFARLLNRTLVWPGNGQLLRYIDLDRLGALHPVISETELPHAWDKQAASMALNEGHDVVYPSRADYEAQPEQVAWMQSKEGGQLPSQMYMPRFLHDEWGAGSSESDRAVLVMNMKYPNVRLLFGGFPPAMHSSIDLWCMDALRIHPSLLSLTDRAMESFQATSAADGQQNFPAELTAGIHWRLGDYVGHPRFQQTIISVDAAVTWTKEVMDRERAAGRDTSRFSVYIAAEGEPDVIVQYKQRARSIGVHAVWLWGNVSHSAAFTAVHRWPTTAQSLATDGASTGIIEATLLSQARYFLGTARSTFTETVLRIRSTSAAHRADALQGLRRWDRTSGTPGGSVSYTAAVWPPDAYEPLPAPVACTTVNCELPTATVFEPPYPGTKPPPHLMSDLTRSMWRDAIAPAKRS